MYKGNVNKQKEMDGVFFEVFILKFGINILDLN